MAIGKINMGRVNTRFLQVFIICLVAHCTLINCKKRKHAPVVAFFQGDCSHKFCEQKCRDIDHGGYACECYHGYKLDNNGMSCT
ncbi:hypothetical protein DPMN_083823, partial [Dreissena polymorpha]